MEVPGRAALVSGIEAEFDRSASTKGFTARGRVADVDTRFRTVRLTGELTAGRLAARAEVRVFARREGTPPEPGTIRALLADEPGATGLAGCVAFVAGGSRGLGAAVAQALAVAGCTVHIGFRDSHDEARALVAGLGPDGERVRLHPGDVGDPEWCVRTRELIAAEDGPVELLVLCAGPPAQTLDLHPATVARAAAHIGRAVQLAEAPLAAFADDLVATGGRIAVVSSAYAEEPRQGLAHYSAAKRAVEGVLEAFAAERPQVGVLIARPPRLATSFTDSVAGQDEALAVEPVAVAIVRGLAVQPAGTSSVVTDFAEPARTAPPAEEVEEREAAVVPAPPRRGVLAVAATFTTDPLRPVLEHWIDRLGLGLDVRLTPYGQVFQQLLDPASEFARNRQGCNVVLVRLADWPQGSEGSRTVDEFATAAAAAAATSAVPLVILLCPAPPAIASAREAELGAAQARLRAAVDGSAGLHLVEEAHWSGPYPVPDHYDAAREEHAHIPFTPPAMAALGTAVVRHVHALIAPPFKVLVLDCDNTLWAGVCGEDGPDGVRLTAAHRAVQRWAVDQHDRGVLLCLCSKNSEEDVDEVFARRAELELRPEHIAARRIDWQPKPANLTALAAELGLGLDSFVFLDDNPVEVAAVRAAHPQVLALRLPADADQVPGFLQRIWAFDRPTVTAEDRRRTSMYRAGRERERLRGSAATLADFVSGLQLRTDIHRARPDQFDRVAQLTQRTNQFNLSGIRRTETELRAALADGADCWVVEAADRFGDYGLVGAAITRPRPEGLELDTFLMSCRVLGRGVEHAFLAGIAQGAAAEGGAGSLVATLRPTGRNTPVRPFLEEVFGAGPGRAEADGTVVHRASLTTLAGLSFRPDEAGLPQERPDGADSPVLPTTTGDPVRVAALAELAAELTDAEALRRAIDGDHRDPVPLPRTVAAGTPAPLDAVRHVLGRLRRIPAATLRADTTLESLRLESLEVVDATVALEKQFGRLPAALFFEHRTLGELAGALAGTGESPRPESPRSAQEAAPVPPRLAARPAGETAGPEDGIAVVGIAGRYPGARDTAELWRNLTAGTESITDASVRWEHGRHVDPAGGPDKTYTAAGGLLDGVDEFDALFFNLAPSEAETMDPQQRLFLQTAYHALEDAGHTPESLGRNVGVFVASMGPDYAVLSANAALTGDSRYPNSDLYQIANRVSYFMDLTGPSIALDTACSGSGVALQLACDAIRGGTVTAAIAGGVNLILHPARRIQYAQLGMLSPTGRCRPFGAGADGMVTSEGVGAVLLRPLRAALADGDHIYGVIRAAGTNSGGRTGGFTVPSPKAQAALISDTLSRAGLRPADIHYVEAHGTGTPLGDPIEIRGLTRVFGGATDGPLPVGSIKSNIGHTEAAAAVAGLTKVLLQLHHRTLVPSLHAEHPNPAVDFDRTPFHVQQRTAEWRPPAPGVPLRAALSSFGAGGVNAHLVVEEAPERRSTEPSPAAGPHLVLLSALDDDRLREQCRRLAARLRTDGNPTVADIAFTLRAGRAELDHRLALVVADRAELLAALELLADAADIAQAVRALGAAAHGRTGSAQPSAVAELFDGSAEVTDLLRGLARRRDYFRLGGLWCQGARVDWAEVLPRGDCRRVPLPGYPFARERHWLPDPVAVPARGAEPGRPAAGTALFSPEWEPAGAAPARPGAPSQQLVVALGGDALWAAPAELRYDGPGLPALPSADGRELVVVDRRALDDNGSAERPEALYTAVALAREALSSGRRTVYVCLTRPADQDPLSAAVSGFGRAFAQESPLLRTVRIEVGGDHRGITLAEALAEAGHGAAEVRRAGDRRLLRRWRAVPAPTGGGLRTGGHYLVTGGAGGVGRLLAAALAERHGASVTLLGRSPEPAGASTASRRIHYAVADVTDRPALAAVLREARTRSGPLTGVIHAAGVLRDGLLRAKSDEALDQVLAPKVTGTVLLDELTADDDLDFFLLMSSYVGVFGNAGQTDYCAANRFLDAFAEQRSARAARGERRGRTVSALWPLWADGGMRMPAAVRRLAATSLGLEAIGTEEALRAFEAVVALDRPVVLIGSGDERRLAEALAGLEPEAAVFAAPDTSTVADADAGGEAVVAWLRDRVLGQAAELAKVPVERIDPGAELGVYGFNSLLFTDLANRLNDVLGTTVTPVLFFESPTVERLAAELYRRHPAETAAAVTASAATAPAGPASVDGPGTSRSRTVTVASQTAPVVRATERPGFPVAVIGMAGRLPGAPDLATYWANLTAARTSVGEAAPWRSDGDRLRGGFLDDILAFDAAFFGVSPREARLMDPQQRLFLETGWHAIENAGYDPRALGGTATGVFVGATLTDYAELLAKESERITAHSVTGHVQSIIANRLSYLLDLRGPSEVVDTACSSSLTALHRALGALEAGECDLAVAGGVNALFSRTWFESLGKAGMLSATGRCWTFDERADGFVRGEGVGAVVLKPLDRARRDGDDIKAVIRGSAVNHGGRAHSLTAPNPGAQADVVAAALRRAGVEPRTVSYIETHGTGTRLGDPIEVAGLRAAFARLGAPDGEPWCSLGAVKTNIGHLESAAGIAGLLKVLLALRHRTLPPSAAGERSNPHLDLAGGPFRVLTAGQPWRPMDGNGAPLPLRAGVSAFGFGGANAHVVVEEAPAAAPGPVDDGTEHLFVLSAADQERLRAYTELVRRAVATEQPELADLAHTSRTGRPALAARLAIVATTRAELLERMDARLAGRAATGLYPGAEPTGESGPLRETARRWVAGESVAWPADPARRKVAFPGYPFDHATAHGPLRNPGPDREPEAVLVPRLLARTWEAASESDTEPAGRKRWLLVGRTAGPALLEDLAGEEADWIVVRAPSALPALAAHEYETDLDDHGAGRRIAEELLTRHGRPEALVDLVDVTGGPTGEAGRVGLLQTLAGRRDGGDLRLVHVRRTIAESGAEGERMAALVRAVGAEYAAVRAVTVDTDGPADGEHGALRTALRELAAAGTEPEVRYRDGVREVARLAELTAATGGGTATLGLHPIDPDRAYVITGGTGGLGLAAAELLVERGARRIALTGRRPLPPREQWPLPGRAPVEGGPWWHERVAAVRRLEAAGAEVMLHSGDAAATAGFLTEVRRRLGPIAGVLHCAGAVGPTPAFVHKPYDEITDCWAPKVDGLAELDRALASDDPDFVVLYSSISAVVPALAVGLADYAAANAVLDAHAARAQARAKERGSRTRWLAISWGSWAGPGMGEVTSPRYRDLGLGGLRPDEGLGLLDTALATVGLTGVVAVAAGSDAAGRLLPGTRSAVLVPPAPAVSPPVASGHDEPKGTEGLTELCAAHLTDVLADALLLDAAGIGRHTPFADLGVDSILIAGIVAGLEELTAAPLEPSVVLEYPSVARLTDHLMTAHQDALERWAAGRRTVAPGREAPVTAPAAPVPAVPTGAFPLAVIGMAGRFPGTTSTTEFWELLRNGRSGVREVPRSRWDVATLYSPEYREGRSISKWGGFLDGIEDFDPEYFGIPEADAAHLDPVTRLFLECAEQTFADAGYTGDDLAGRRVGVFVGSGTGDYGSRIEIPGRATATGLNQNFIAAHLAHFRDLRGPNLVVDTACSSSLTALHLAGQALRLGECDLALAGAADLILDERPYLSLSAARALSPDGACHVFDAGANGFVPGEGAGALLLKPLDRALDDGDRILAVVEATAVNNDGRTMGLTTPNPLAQQEVVREALRRAGADAASVSYVEAHGTGTMIGDPIELRALTEVFRERTAERGFCAVGSVKSNVGHLLMAAGMAGLQKVVLSLMHRALPPTLHCEHPNPRFAFEESPFRPNTELREWQPRFGVRRAGVSAFGFGGTNGHAVLRGLTDVERASRPVRRSPLPPPVFHRRRHWVERVRPQPAAPSLLPLLDLEEVIQP
ncbi:SDR family NAD(P)-dependent oxidoreductase [Kitasatospora sp. NPDC091207]|uniref:SDR family NAD(P)-dependent oxidoreductase n=1 Tax=Kitasatospora sp. NPDC091207 TaxID=3364083 RepID=UPI0037FF7A04